MKPLKIFVCAGEASGDMHAAALVAELRKLAGERPLELRGFGGKALKEQGCELLYNLDQTAVMGITPVLAKLPFFLRMFRDLKAQILEWKPDVVLTVDYPGMNLRLAKFAHSNGFKAAHYICPQVWAWHRGRIPKIAKFLDLLLCILPFEPELFKPYGLDARYIGHPLAERAAETVDAGRLLLPWLPGKYRVALLPGSRRTEIVRIYPRLLKAARLLRESCDCTFLVPAASPKIRALLEDTPGTEGLPLRVIDGNAREVLLQADAAAVASGTATLEACLMGCPTVLVYAVSAITALAGRLLINGVKWIGLANIIANKTVMPELIQGDFTPQAVCNVLRPWLCNPDAREKVLRELAETSALLDSDGASAKAAKAVLELANRS